MLEVLNRANKLDTNKLEMESRCSVSVSGAASDTKGGMLHTYHRYPFRASDRQISPRSPKTHYDYDEIRRRQSGSDGQEFTGQSITRQPLITSSSSDYRSFTRLPSNQQSVGVDNSLSVSTCSSSVEYAVERTLEKQYQSNPFVISSAVGGQAQLSHDQTTAQLVHSARNRAAASQQRVKVRPLDGKLPGSGTDYMELLSREGMFGPDVETEFSIEIDPGNFEFAARGQINQP